MTEPQRVLIDFDFGAAGIWKVLSVAELKAPAPEGAWASYAPLRPKAPSPRPWSDRLAVDLLDALQEWNDLGVHLVCLGNGDAAQLDALWARGAQLAHRVQGELGSDHVVLYAIPEGAWRWVYPPWE